MQKLFLPAWCLPKGTINAADDQLEEASSSCERWGIWCGALVIVSVVAELVIAHIQPPYSLFLRDSAFTDAGIAIGIVGEVLLGMWNNRIQTELRKRSNTRLEEAVKTAGIANERAAELEKEAAEARERTAEIERLTAPRHISPDQEERIIAAINDGIKGTNLLIEYERGDPEAFRFAWEIASMFKRAGLKKIRFIPNSFLSAPAFGIFIAAAENLKQIDGSLWVTAFAKAGISASGLVIDLSTHLSREQIPPDIYIFVGAKPPPRPLFINITDTSTTSTENRTRE